MVAQRHSHHHPVLSVGREGMDTPHSELLTGQRLGDSRPIGWVEVPTLQGCFSASSSPPFFVRQGSPGCLVVSGSPGWPGTPYLVSTCGVLCVGISAACYCTPFMPVSMQCRGPELCAHLTNILPTELHPLALPLEPVFLTAPSTCPSQPSLD